VKKKGKPKMEDIEVNLRIAMPRVMVDSTDAEGSAKAEKIMEVLSQACLAMIQANKDAQLSMDMLSFVSESNKTLHISFKENEAFDLDHFRMLIVALTASYEGVMKGFQIKIVQPIDFSKIEQFNGIPSQPF